MASVRRLKPKDSKSPWIVEYTDAEGARRRATPPSGLKKDADALRQQIEREIGEGVHVATSTSATIHDLAMAWLSDCDRRAAIGDKMTMYTVRNYRSFINNHIAPEFGRTKVSQLDPLAITRWLQTKRPEYKLTTVAHIHRCFSLLLDFAVKTRRAKRNVMVDFKVRPPGGEKQRIKVPSMADARALFEAIETRAHRERVVTHLNRRAVIPLALFCTLRRGEIVALKWENVRFDLGIIQVRHSFNAVDGLKAPKTSAGLRDVQMPPIVLDALLALQAQQGSPATGFVLRGSEGGHIGPNHLYLHYWLPTLRRAGLLDEAGKPLFHFHALRHAAVSLLISQGLSPIHIKTMVGHSKVSTTLDIYGHLFPEDERIKGAVAGVAQLFNATRTRHEQLNH